MDQLFLEQHVQTQKTDIDIFLQDLLVGVEPLHLSMTAPDHAMALHGDLLACQFQQTLPGRLVKTGSC